MDFWTIVWALLFVFVVLPIIVVVVILIGALLIDVVRYIKHKTTRRKK